MHLYEVNVISHDIWPFTDSDTILGCPLGIDKEYLGTGFGGQYWFTRLSNHAFLCKKQNKKQNIIWPCSIVKVCDIWKYFDKTKSVHYKLCNVKPKYNKITSLCLICKWLIIKEKTMDMNTHNRHLITSFACLFVIFKPGISAQLLKKKKEKD